MAFSVFYEKPRVLTIPHGASHDIFYKGVGTIWVRLRTKATDLP